jgi:hypothetical protein
MTKGYFSLTRTHSYSLLFALPLLLLYEAGAVYISNVEGSNLRNGADVLLRGLLAIAGAEGTAALAVGVSVIAVILIILERRRKRVPLRAGPFFGMAVESIVYAMLLGLVVGSATQRLLDVVAMQAAGGSLTTLSPAQGLVLSLGAGLYEELFFRVLLCGGIFGALRGSGLSNAQAGAVAVLLASVIFSAFHYVGPYGDPWELPSFLFRFLAGLAFSLLFLLRGFGITAWSHALYDVFLVVAVTL